MDTSIASWFIDGILKAGLPVGAIVWAAWWVRGVIAQNTEAIQSVKSDVAHIKTQVLEIRGTDIPKIQRDVTDAHLRIDRHLEGHAASGG